MALTNWFLASSFPCREVLPFSKMVVVFILCWPCTVSLFRNVSKVPLFLRPFYHKRRAEKRGDSVKTSMDRPAVVDKGTRCSGNIDNTLKSEWEQIKGTRKRGTFQPCWSWRWDVIMLEMYARRLDRSVDVFMLVLNQISNSDLKPNFGYKSRFRMSAS
jgi:hypothetical protein